MANSAIAKMYGYDSVDDFMNIETTQLLTVPEHQTNLHRDRLKGSRVEADNEHLGQKADGTPFWVRKRTFVIEWDGEPAICSIREDISQAKQSEEALKQSEERFRGAIEGLQEGFALYSPDDKLVMCNDEFRNLHQHCLEYIQPGVSFEAMTRHNAENGHNTDAAGRVEEYIQERMEKHRNPKGPIIRHNTEGVVRLITETKLPDGGTIITQNDITEVVQAEAEVKRQKTLFEAAINNAPYAMLMTNMEREVILCNPEFARMFGYTEDETVGQSTEILYQNKNDFEARDHIRTLLNDRSE